MNEFIEGFFCECCVKSISLSIFTKYCIQNNLLFLTFSHNFLTRDNEYENEHECTKNKQTVCMEGRNSGAGAELDE